MTNVSVSLQQAKCESLLYDSLLDRWTSFGLVYDSMRESYKDIPVAGVWQLWLFGCQVAIR